MASKNDSLIIMGDWRNPETHKEIRQKIRQMYPGYSIHGYALAKENNDEKLS